MQDNLEVNKEVQWLQLFHMKILNLLDFPKEKIILSLFEATIILRPFEVYRV